MVDMVHDSATIGGISILVVDDDALVRSIVIEYLQAFGFKRIHEAKSGGQAIRMIQDQKVAIDLVLSDWEMGNVNGLMVLKALRSNPMRAHVKFIMVTSQSSQERMKISRARAQNVDAYIIKPFKGKTLKEKIWSVMGWEHNDVSEAG